MDDASRLITVRELAASTTIDGVTITPASVGMREVSGALNEVG